jgi:hypothetical protein
LHARARVLTDEQGAVAKTRRVFGLEVRRRAEDQNVHHLDLAQFMRALDERVEQNLRRAGTTADVHALTGLDYFHRIFC